MQPVRLVIHGDFWDSFLYRGRFYLWDMDNTIRIYNWDQFIGTLADKYQARVLTFALSRGDALYYDFQNGNVLSDPDILKLLREKMERLSDLPLTFTLKDLAPFLIGKQDSPFNDLHDDLEIFKSTIYALTDTGLYKAGAHKPLRNKYKVTTRPTKLWEGRGISLSAATSGRLAIAAGNDGLFELNIRYRNSNEPEQIAERHTAFAGWLFASIFGSSPLAPGYLAAYHWQEVEVQEGNRPQLERYFDGIIDAGHIFATSQPKGQNVHTLSWGSQEKIYEADANSVSVVRFTQKYLNSIAQEPFKHIGEMPLNLRRASYSAPVAAGVAYFGTLIEYEDGFVILESDIHTYEISEQVTRWRVFPRSRRYENHLHVVLEDRLEILSFNHDYFVNQEAKLAGIKYNEPRSRET